MTADRKRGETAEIRVNADERDCALSVRYEVVPDTPEEVPLGEQYGLKSVLLQSVYLPRGRVECNTAVRLFFNKD